MNSVLVFEDEWISQALAQRALQRLGFAHIAVANDGVVGLKMLDGMQVKPDLIILDIFMPEKDGIEIVNALIERQFAGGLILVTGADTQYLQVAATMAVSHGLQFLGSISKPLRDEALTHVLSQFAKV